ncbi:TPA: site-specific integrase, partial [Pseudomonas aeruginosa]|nr:site-specific integrase [Pseudomonas aeruginosa]
PSSAQICAALMSVAPEFTPNSFRVLKNALAYERLARGDQDSAEQIRTLKNPVTAEGSGIRRKPRPKQVKSVPYEDFEALAQHLTDGQFEDELAALILAFHLGARPCEMRTITVTGHLVQIIGGKKNAKRDRGADRTLEIEDVGVLGIVEWAARRLRESPRSNTAIRDRLRVECRKLWRRRKSHPTLKSFRHRLGSALKASGESPAQLAYVMGHQSIGSIAVYGDRRAGQGMKVYVRPARGADLSRIRTLKSPPRYGRERQADEVSSPLAQ